MTREAELEEALRELRLRVYAVPVPWRNSKEWTGDYEALYRAMEHARKVLAKETSHEP
jgi:hypothetical protein